MKKIGQSAAKHLNNLPIKDEGSTTIPEGSRSKIIDRKAEQPSKFG